MRLPQDWTKARVTLGLAAAAAASWVVVSLFGLDEWAALNLGFIPARVGLASDPLPVPIWITPLTAPLVHVSFLQLFFNLLLLMVCGRPTETVLGPVGLGILFVLGLCAAAITAWLVDPQGAYLITGAGGGVSAVIGAFAIMFGRHKLKIASGTLAVWLNALWLLAAWIGIQLMVALVSWTSALIPVIAGDVAAFLIGLLVANPLLLLRYRRA